MPVVKADAAAQVHDVRERVWIVESRCQVGLGLQIGAQDEQRAEDQLRDALRDLVAGLARIERVGRGPDPDRDDRRIDAPARGGRRRRPAWPPRAASGGQTRVTGGRRHLRRPRHRQLPQFVQDVQRRARRCVVEVERRQARQHGIGAPPGGRGNGGVGKEPQLLRAVLGVRRVCRTAAAGQLVALQADQDLLGARNDARRQARQPGHLDAVAAIGAARENLPQEHDVVLPFARRHVGVDDAGPAIGQVRQLMVMRGEERLGPGRRMARQVLRDGPGDAQPVEGRCAAANLVEHDQAPRGGRVQDVGGLLHLHHEGGLAPGDVVGGAHPGVDAIDDRQLRVAGRHERAHLRQHGEQRRLPQVGGLSAHVRARQDDEVPRGAVEIDVVRHEAAGDARLDHRVADVCGHQLVAVVHVGLGVVAHDGRFGQRRQHVQRGQRARAGLDARGFGRHRPRQLLEDHQLAGQDPLVRAQDLGLVLAERRRAEALAAGNRLLALVVRRGQVQVGLRDLDVVAEHPVEADLQRADAGPLAFRRFHVGDDLPARSADRPQLVDLGIQAVLREAAFARQRRRVVGQRALDALPHVGQVVQLGAQAPDERGGGDGQDLRDARDERAGSRERDEVARPGRAEHHPAQQAFEIL